MTVASASRERWVEAQEAEREFWAGATHGQAVLGGAVQSLTRVADWARGRVPVDAGAQWLELGIGPLGVGVAHLLRAGPGAPRIVGVDPIGLDDESPGRFADPLASLIAG